LISVSRHVPLAASGLVALLAAILAPVPAGNGEDARVAEANRAVVAILASLEERDLLAPTVPDELSGSGKGGSAETAVAPTSPSQPVTGQALRGAGISPSPQPTLSQAATPLAGAEPSLGAEPGLGAEPSLEPNLGAMASRAPAQGTNARFGQDARLAQNSSAGRQAAPAEAVAPVREAAASGREAGPTAEVVTGREAASASGVPVLEASPSSSSPSSAAPSSAAPSSWPFSPSAAIDYLLGGGQRAAPAIPASVDTHVALALPYGEADANANQGLPKFVVPAPSNANTDHDGAGPGLLPKDLEPASVMPGDSNPALAPLPAFIAPPDADAAKLAIAAYRKGDTALGDAYSAATTTEVARVALEWAAIRSDSHGTGFGRLTAFLKDHPEWPSASWLRRRGEEALYADKQGFTLLASYFSKAQPETAQGKLALARLEREQGRLEEATALVRDVWREGDINQTLESKLIEEFGGLLTPADHKFRADRAFYKEESGRLLRAAKLAGDDEMALAKAQFAVIDEAHNADALLAALPAKLKSDPSYTFARIEILRRANKPDKLAEAVKLMLSAPRDPDVIVDGDAWWIERRLIARKLLDAGDAQTAYQICAEHGAQSAEMRIEAEFHAGWIALRFLGDPTLAAPHFVTAAAVAALPASVARAAYWQGRTAQALGDEAAATAAYSQAAEHVTTYYGQLARSKLGLSDLPLRQTRKLATGDGRELAIRVAEFFYALGETDFALPIVADAARHFTDEGQMAALGKVVETGRDARAALILGKLATQRGIPLDDFAFPIFGVPFYQPVANSADRTIVYAIARQESAFAPTATSTAGAKGLMQLMPDTARRAALHAGIALDMAKLNSDAALNARIGAAHLGELFAEEGGSYVLTFAAYNAGGKRVKEWIAAHGDPRRGDVDPVDWIELIPITETRDYVQRIIENMQVYRTRFGEASRPINEADLRRPGGG
jgi:soluble lytic murein transglycosylase